MYPKCQIKSRPLKLVAQLQSKTIHKIRVEYYRPKKLNGDLKPATSLE
jgi:hypothetical protein